MLTETMKAKLGDLACELNIGITTVSRAAMSTSS